MMRRVAYIVAACAAVLTVQAQTPQQPDTTGMAAYMAEVDSLLRLDAQRRRGSGEAARQEAQQRMIQNLRYVRLGDKFEMGPVTRLVVRNSVDGFRTRIGGRTTAALHPRLFWQGYVSRGFRSRQNYFSSQLTCTFNDKRHVPDEYPRRSVSWLAVRELGLPFEILRGMSDSGLLASLRWTTVDRFVRYNRQQLSAGYEWNRRLSAGVRLSASSVATVGGWQREELRVADIGLCAALRAAPRSVVSLSHRTGVKGLLRGQYNYNLSEIGYTGLFGVGAGCLDVCAQAGVQWNRVPRLLLCMPAANMSYLSEKHAFSLINNDEFANDRYVSIMLGWDMGGALLSRVPLLARLGCHEYVGVRSLWGAVSDKNNCGVSLMDGAKPYCECSAGICNILGILSVEYVRRLNYLDRPSARVRGIRVGVAI